MVVKAIFNVSVNSNTSSLNNYLNWPYKLDHYKLNIPIVI